MGFITYVEGFSLEDIFALFSSETSQNEAIVQLTGYHCTGKMAIKNPSGKTQGILKFCQNTWKTQGIWFAQVVNSLISKDKRYFNFCRKKTKHF